MENKPLLTIAIPTYNGAKTIRNMLDIMLPQCTDEVEVLVSDNGSTDDTPSIVGEYRIKYPFIKYHRNKENIGADGNFLECMRLAKGKYIFLLSDDDILVENSLQRILEFLESSPDMGLVYLSSTNFWVHYDGIEYCINPIEITEKNICTQDKKLFMSYAKHYWGFLSSFILNKSRFEQIINPEQFYGTYWLQSYIHILCSAGNETYLGIVGDICIAAGVYVTQSNFDIGFVDGVSYKRMLDFAVQQGYDEKQLQKWFVDRICLLAGHGIIKEKANGNIKTDKKKLFKCTYMYLKCWALIYPKFLMPGFVCRAVMKLYRKLKNATLSDSVNRDGDFATLKK
ncbi:MAG: glycosyltransferase [Oscillospiraceae bacterium]|nr:glycosyltransferase [Oscillospiraceae bacterium]